FRKDQRCHYHNSHVAGNQQRECNQPTAKRRHNWCLLSGSRVRVTNWRDYRVDVGSAYLLKRFARAHVPVRESDGKDWRTSAQVMNVAITMPVACPLSLQQAFLEFLTVPVAASAITRPTAFEDVHGSWRGQPDRSGRGDLALRQPGLDRIR